MRIPQNATEGRARGRADLQPPGPGWGLPWGPWAGRGASWPPETPPSPATSAGSRCPSLDPSMPPLYIAVFLTSAAPTATRRSKDNDKCIQNE